MEVDRERLRSMQGRRFAYGPSVPESCLRLWSRSPHRPSRFADGRYAAGPRCWCCLASSERPAAASVGEAAVCNDGLLREVEARAVAVRFESEGHPPQLTAFFTSAPILASSAVVKFLNAKEVGHMAPSSRFALSLKPNVAYRVLNLCAL